MVNISNEQRENAWRMYQEGKTIRYIAHSVEVSYSSAWAMTAGRKRGFKKRSEYQEQCAKKRI